MAKKITNYKYETLTPDGKTEEESLAKVLANLLLISARDNNLKGIDMFRKYNKFFKIVREAEKTKVIEIEDKDYNYLKDLVIKEIPPAWGANPEIWKTIENFLSA